MAGTELTHVPAMVRRYDGVVPTGVKRNFGTSATIQSLPHLARSLAPSLLCALAPSLHLLSSLPLVSWFSFPLSLSPSLVFLLPLSLPTPPSSCADPTSTQDCGAAGTRLSTGTSGSLRAWTSTETRREWTACSWTTSATTARACTASGARSVVQADSAECVPELTRVGTDPGCVCVCARARGAGLRRQLVSLRALRMGRPRGAALRPGLLPTPLPSFFGPDAWHARLSGVGQSGVGCSS
eukprot:3339660-Rhodomonas_salina.2